MAIPRVLGVPLLVAEEDQFLSTRLCGGGAARRVTPDGAALAPGCSLLMARRLPSGAASLALSEMTGEGRLPPDG